MHPQEAKRRRLMALHNAEIAGREWAKSGGSKDDHPYRGKRVRGPMVKLLSAWMRGFDEQAKNGPS